MSNPSTMTEPNLGVCDARVEFNPHTDVLNKSHIDSSSIFCEWEEFPTNDFKIDEETGHWDDLPIAIGEVLPDEFHPPEDHTGEVPSGVADSLNVSYHGEDQGHPVAEIEAELEPTPIYADVKILSDDDDSVVSNTWLETLSVLKSIDVECQDIAVDEKQAPAPLPVIHCKSIDGEEPGGHPVKKDQATPELNASSFAPRTAKESVATATPGGTISDCDRHRHVRSSVITTKPEPTENATMAELLTVIQFQGEAIQKQNEALKKLLLQKQNEALGELFKKQVEAQKAVEDAKQQLIADAQTRDAIAPLSYESQVMALLHPRCKGTITPPLGSGGNDDDPEKVDKRTAPRMSRGGVAEHASGTKILDWDIRPSDVKMGRSGFGTHLGNKFLRKLIKDNLQEYNASPKMKKLAMSWEVFQTITREGGRFLKQLKNEGYWVEVNCWEAREKIASTFRGKRKRSTH